MQRGRPPGGGTATSLAPSSGTPLQPSRRAARAGYSAVRSGEEVKIALSTSSGRKPFASWRARSSSTVASRIAALRSEEHTSELQSLAYLVCRLLLEKKKKNRERVDEGR